MNTYTKGLPILHPIHLRYEVSKRVENVLFKMAKRLPQRFRMIVLADCGAYATCGKYGSTVVPEVGFMEVMKRNEER